MKRWQMGAAVAMGLGVLAGGSRLWPAAETGESIPWLGDWEAGRAAAIKSGRPLFVAFR